MAGCVSICSYQSGIARISGISGMVAVSPPPLSTSRYCQHYQSYIGGRFVSAPLTKHVCRLRNRRTVKKNKVLKCKHSTIETYLLYIRIFTVSGVAGMNR
jgi:hypothetical protein